MIVSPETMYMSQQWRQLLMSHIIPDIVPTGSMQDEQTLSTVNRHAKIRINFYNAPRRVREEITLQSMYPWLENIDGIHGKTPTYITNYY